MTSVPQGTTATWQDYRRDLDLRVETTARNELEERFAAQVTDRRDLRRLVGTAQRDEPVHRWVAYKEAFSPQLVRVVLDYLGIASGRLLDPFAGVGTSLLVAAERNMAATGVELLPYSAFVAATKLRAADVDASAAREIALGAAADRNRRPGAFPDFPVRNWAFSAPVLAELTRLHRSISAQPSSINADLCRLALLSVVEQVSQATKDGTSLRRRSTSHRRIGRYGATWSRAAVRDLFIEQVDGYLADAIEASQCPECRCVVGDARALPTDIIDEGADVAMFSPPYPNRYDYSANYQLELGFGFVAARSDLKALRASQMRSHLECPWPARRQVELAALDEFLSAYLARRQLGDESGRVFKMIAGYFEDMSNVLDQVAGTVKMGGQVVIVVGTQVFGGQQLPTDLLLAALAEDRFGMVLKNLWVARDKGVAVQQRKRFAEPCRSRESILILER